MLLRSHIDVHLNLSKAIYFDMKFSILKFARASKPDLTHKIYEIHTFMLKSKCIQLQIMMTLIEEKVVVSNQELIRSD